MDGRHELLLTMGFVETTCLLVLVDEHVKLRAGREKKHRVSYFPKLTSEKGCVRNSLAWEAYQLISDSSDVASSCLKQCLKIGHSFVNDNDSFFLQLFPDALLYFSAVSKCFFFLYFVLQEAASLGKKVVLFDYVQPSPQGTTWGR